MEGETSPEEQREAIKFEAQQLAERHGISLSELANIIGERTNDDEGGDNTSESQEPNTKFSDLADELRVLTGQKWEGYASNDLSGEGIRNSDARIEEIMNEFGYSPGTSVVVERSNGDVEDDWQIGSIDVGSGQVHVTKTDDTGRSLSKNIPMTDFLERNLGIKYHAESS